LTADSVDAESSRAVPAVPTTLTRSQNGASLRSMATSTFPPAGSSSTPVVVSTKPDRWATNRYGPGGTLSTLNRPDPSDTTTATCRPVEASVTVTSTPGSWTVPSCVVVAPRIVSAGAVAATTGIAMQYTVMKSARTDRTKMITRS
jgi:hypothetical protein